MRHAYLIIVHKDNLVLRTFLRIMDEINVDFYVHVDAKCKNFKFEEIGKICTKSKIYFITRTKVYWGDFSQVNAELLLLRESVGGGYDYFHLISGQDLPIKSPFEISAFFEKNRGKEFIDVGNNRFPIQKQKNDTCFSLYSRVSLYHLLIKGWRKNKILKAIEFCSISLQQKLNVNRLRKSEVPLFYGSNWFSITKDCAKYVVSKEDDIKKIFGRWTRASDELFLQTIIMKSDFKKDLWNSNLREIDWNRGKPYIWENDDLQKLLESKNLFARKFDENVDADIIRNIECKLTN